MTVSPMDRNAAFQHFGVVAVDELAASLLAAAAGGGGSAVAIAHANASMAALDSLFAAQRAAEGSGEWSGLFFGDRSRRRDCHFAAPPSPSSRRINRDGEGASAK